MKQLVLESEIGPLHLVANENHLTGVFWWKPDIPLGTNAILEWAAREIGEFFAGQRQAFSVPHFAKGTPFQESVWAELARIPYGQTISYAELARRVRNPKAVRAVGHANGRNPLSLIVPCHRVIASDGSLGGYAGTLARKERLLALERATVEADARPHHSTDARPASYTASHL